jgi:hypothetical protein
LSERLRNAARTEVRIVFNVCTAKYKEVISPLDCNFWACFFRQGCVHVEVTQHAILANHFQMRLHKDLGVNIENALQHRRRGVELHYWKHGSLAELYDDHIISD